MTRSLAILCIALVGTSLAAPRKQPLQQQREQEREDSQRNTDSQSQNYRFQYEVENPEDSAPLRQDDKVAKAGVKGPYGYRKPTGEFRVVDYLADEYGFNARLRQSKEREESTTTTTEAPQSAALEQLSQLKDNYDSVTSSVSTSVSTSSRSSPIKSRQERNKQLQQLQQQKENDAIITEQKREERLEQLNEQPEQLEQKAEKVIREAPDVLTTPIPMPKVVMTGQREIEGRNVDQSIFVKPVKQTPFQLQPQQPTRKSIANKISIHQLVSEAMPSLQMSVVPVYFVNKVTKNVMAIPYLVMKSVSKMPLLPGMFDGVNGISQNLINFQHSATPHRVQRSNFRSGSHLLPLLGNGEPSTGRSNQLVNNVLRNGQQKEADNDLEAELEGEREQTNEWMPMNGGGDAQFTEQSNTWWRK